MFSADDSTRECVGHNVDGLRAEQNPCGPEYSGSGGPGDQ
jgi:hypothetical protein